WRLFEAARRRRESADRTKVLEDGGAVPGDDLFLLVRKRLGIDKLQHSLNGRPHSGGRRLLTGARDTHPGQRGQEILGGEHRGDLRADVAQQGQDNSAHRRPFVSRGRRESRIGPEEGSNGKAARTL